MQRDDLCIKQLTAAHLPMIERLERRCFTVPWTAEVLEDDLLRNPWAVYLGALAGQKLVGYAALWVPRETSMLTSLAVDPDWRGQDIGRMLLQAAMQLAVLLGAREMTLDVRAHNAAAQRLYQSAGFVAVGIRQAYYPDNGEDAWVMWCPLG